jgi:hypothetical protein
MEDSLMSVMTRDLIFDQLQTLGLASVRIAFYGGHDEGCVEGIKCLDANEQELSVEIDEDSELFESLCQPIYDYYGGFDGDPEVDGELIWRVPDRSLSLEGSQKSWESFMETL